MSATRAGDSGHDGYEVERAYKHVCYREGDRTITFDREPSEGDLPALLWFPSPKRWRESMPEWAQGRRREILSRLRAVVRGDEWRVSYAYVDTVRPDDLDPDPA